MEIKIPAKMVGKMWGKMVDGGGWLVGIEVGNRFFATKKGVRFFI